MGTQGQIDYILLINEKQRAILAMALELLMRDDAMSLELLPDALQAARDLHSMVTD